MRECADRERLNTRPCHGEANPQAKLTAGVVMAMREQYAEGGVSQVALAVEFGVARSLVHRVVTGRSWAHLPMPKRRKRRGPGYCACGCGHRTPLAKATNARLGHVKGKPVRFIHGHAGARAREAAQFDFS